MSDSCTDSYIGFTSRHLFVRCAEHLNTNLKQQSEIKDHVINCSACNNSTLCYKNFSVVRRCRDAVHAKLFEAFAIKRFRPSLNKQLFAQGASMILHVWKWLNLCILSVFAMIVLFTVLTFSLLFLDVLIYLEKESLLWFENVRFCLYFC